MNDSNPKAVDFLGYEIALVEDDDGKMYVPLKRLCEILGINHNRQRRKIKDYNLCKWKIMPVPGIDGNNYRMFCVRFDDLGWLRGEATTVRSELVGKLIAYLEESWRERYWRERSEEGRDLPKVPDNAGSLIAQFSNEIQDSLSQIRETIHRYERYAIYKEVYAAKSPIMLSILSGLSKDLTKLSQEIDDGFHDMLDVNDYWRWCCCNDPEAAKELGKEMESLANQGHRID